jgi:hypothetical protein
MELNIDTLKAGETKAITVTLQFTDADTKYLYKNDVASTTFLSGSAFTFVSSWKFYTSYFNSDCLFMSLRVRNLAHTRYIMYCPLQADNTSTI